MKLFNDIYKFLLGEQSTTSLASGPKMIANAITDRHPVSFFYNGPRDEVQAGRRIKAEMVALGLSKKGKMIVRAWVEPPSRSKTGFDRNNWRTFIVSRMSQVEIFDGETFDVKRPNYKEGDDNSMSVTYVTSNWDNTPEPKSQEVPSEPQQTDTLPEPKPTEPTAKEVPSEPQTVEPQTVEPEREELPQPEPQQPPSEEPPRADDDEEENKELQESIKRIKEILYILN
jgi:hypothetical protein